MSSEPRPGHVVLIGASAGGIEAANVLLAQLSPHFAAPVVIAQHLDPRHASELPAVLGIHSKLAVSALQDGSGLKSGHVYVVPANCHAIFEGGQVRLRDVPPERPRPSIDLMLSSAAGTLGERVVAVILSGSGSDGAAGAVDVKNAGGTVIIQQPSTAAFPSMPQALPPTIVDHAVDIHGMAPLLEQLVSGGEEPETGGPDGDRALQEILTLLNRVCGVDFRQYKPATLLRRIHRRMPSSGARTLPEYLAFAENHPDELAALLRSLLIKVTEFFRDPEAFALLRTAVLSQLIQRGREHGRVLRLWSAGCATGEEAYSLALLVADMLGPELPEWTVKVFATDLDESAIAFARQGVYPSSVLRDLPGDFRARFFEPVSEGFRVVKSLRQRVIFGQQDLSRGVPFPRMDLVVCRNLLIYFRPELQQEVLDLFAYSLHHHQGYLLLGKAETARPSRSAFELVDKRWKVYRCLSGPLPMPTRDSVRAAARARERPDAPVAAHDATDRAADGRSLRRVVEQVLRSATVGMVALDRAYRILAINAAARRLLGVRETGIDQDFLHTVRGLPYDEVRVAIDTLFEDPRPPTLPPLAFDMGPGEETRWLDIGFSLLRADELAGDVALLTVTDVSEATRTHQALATLQAGQQQLTDELASANRRLGAMNKELQDANEELQAANEEMMLAQEELQATNEEFEATNEELQATNEELETNNEELQATNEELETTNEELSARTSELTSTGDRLTAERVRLAAIVDHAPFPVLVVRGPELMVELSNSHAARLLLGPEGVGHPLAEVCRPGLQPLLEAVRQSWRTDQSLTVQAVAQDLGLGGTHAMLFAVAPAHDDAGNLDRVVVYGREFGRPPR